MYGGIYWPSRLITGEGDQASPAVSLDASLHTTSTEAIITRALSLGRRRRNLWLSGSSSAAVVHSMSDTQGTTRERFGFSAVLETLAGSDSAVLDDLPLCYRVGNCVLRCVSV